MVPKLPHSFGQFTKLGMAYFLGVKATKLGPNLVDWAKFFKFPGRKEGTAGQGAIKKAVGLAGLPLGEAPL